MSAHTRGPWETGSGEWSVEQPRATETTSTHWKHVTDKNGNVLAIVVEANMRHAASKMFEANAALIAASPMLLEALQNLVSALAENDEDGLTEFADVMQAARAAIAKATGAA